MRIRIRVGLTAVLLGLAGCVTPPPKPDSPNAPGAPFLGTGLPHSPREPAVPPGVDNLLAGAVFEKVYLHRVANASIQVVDLEDPNPSPAAQLDISANADGYFTIPGLQGGHHYQLIARVKDGDRLLSGRTLAMPPNPRLSIYISEDLTSPTTPAPLAPPAPPTRAPAADRDAIPPPAPPPSDSPVPPKPGGVNSGAAPPPLNHVAIEEPGGFQKVPTAPRVEIPYGKPNPVIPPTPPIYPQTPPTAPPSAAPPPADQASHEGPPPRTAPPFCVLVGNRLDNFALPTVDGQPWEFRRDPPRKLVLLDFWKTNCPACLEAIPHLRGLQDKYGRDGLEVVGVAYEDPTSPEQQSLEVRRTRARLHVNYTLLMGADSRAGPCPVRSQFLVDSFPRLMLIDGTGDILWRSSDKGLSDQAFAELDKTIDWKLRSPLH